MRALIVGAGLMGQWHGRAARRAGAAVAGVFDPDTARAERLARSLGAESFSALDAALQATTPDVTHICSPLASHEAAIEAALSAGSHVLCEKPLAPDATAVRRLLAEAQRQERLLIPTHQFPFQRGVQRAARCLDNLGALQRVTFVTSTAGADRVAGMARDQLLLDILPHPLSLLQALFPDWQDLRWSLLPRRDAHEMMLTAWQGETRVLIDMSTRRRPTECYMRLSGDAASMHIDFFHGFAVMFPGATGQLAKALAPLTQTSRHFGVALLNLLRRALLWEAAYPGLRTLVAQTYGAVRNEQAPPFSPAEIQHLYDSYTRLVDLVGGEAIAGRGC